MSIRHDWYQTDEKVVITVLRKNEQNCKLKLEPTKMLLTTDSFTLDLNFCHEINVEKSTHKVTPFKIEITLAKATGQRWEQLTENPDALAAATKPEPIAAKIYKQDWDSLAKEIEKNEEKEVLLCVCFLVYQILYFVFVLLK